MINLRKLKALMLGHNTNPAKLHAQLEASSVPISAADCRTCSDPCDEGHQTYPARFDMDMETQLLGTVKPYRRQVVISTGVSDWEREVTEAQGSLAAYLLGTQNKVSSPKPKGVESSQPSSVPSLFRSSDSTRISILNGSHSTLCDNDQETVLIFPDYKVITGVPTSTEGAEALWESSIDPSLGRAGTTLENSPFRSWVLPYSCVILLCSHKRRDNRCSIAAPKLEQTFMQSLEHRGWAVHTQIEDPSHIMGSPIEEMAGTQEEKEAYIVSQLQELPSEKRVLILRNSHIGGHKYAGNCIIYTPQGSSIWYGRVTPHEVESIVVNTILGGLVLPPLLRGGMNISRPGCSSLHDW